MTGARSGRSASLDAVRGLAALSIASLHAIGVAGGGPPGGTGGITSTFLETGLAVFFVLSGYLIAGPFVRALVDGSPMPLVSSYALRRLARIGPGYWVAFVVAVLVIASTHPSQPVTQQWGDGHLQAGDWLASALFLQGAVPSAAGEGVLPVMWTLCVEIVFYALTPLLALLALRRLRGRAATPGAAALFVSGLWAGCALLESQLGHIGSGTGNPIVSWICLQLAFASLFCPGVLIAVATTRAASVRWGRALSLLGSPRLRDFGPLLAVLAVVGAFMVYRSNGGDLGLTPSGEWRRQPAAIGAAVVVALALSARGQAWALIARVLAPLGTISYGIYLYHWVVLRVLVDHGVYPLPVPGWALLPAKVALALGLTLPLAALSYLVVERPAMHWAARRSVRSRDSASHPATRMVEARGDVTGG